MPRGFHPSASRVTERTRCGGCGAGNTNTRHQLPGGEPRGADPAGSRPAAALHLGQRHGPVSTAPSDRAPPSGAGPGRAAAGAHPNAPPAHRPQAAGHRGSVPAPHHSRRRDSSKAPGRTKSSLPMAQRRPNTTSPGIAHGPARPGPLGPAPLPSGSARPAEAARSRPAAS